MFDRWQNFLKIFFSEKCSEVCYTKKSIPGKIPGNGFFGRFFGIFEDLYGKTNENYLELFGNVY